MACREPGGRLDSKKKQKSEVGRACYMDPLSLREGFHNRFKACFIKLGPARFSHFLLGRDRFRSRRSGSVRKSWGLHGPGRIGAVVGRGGPASGEDAGAPPLGAVSKPTGIPFFAERSREKASERTGTAAQRRSATPRNGALRVDELGGALAQARGDHLGGRFRIA